MVKLPLAILQFAPGSILCTVTNNIHEQIIFDPEVVNELPGINHKKALLKSQELASKEVNIDNASEKKGMSAIIIMFTQYRQNL